MKIKVNGKNTEAKDGSTVGSLADAWKARRPSLVVAVNLTVLPRNNWDSTILKEGDSVDIFTFMTGG